MPVPLTPACSAWEQQLQQDSQENLNALAQVSPTFYNTSEQLNQSEVILLLVLRPTFRYPLRNSNQC